MAVLSEASFVFIVYRPPAEQVGTHNKPVCHGGCYAPATPAAFVRDHLTFGELSSNFVQNFINNPMKWNVFVIALLTPSLSCFGSDISELRFGGIISQGNSKKFALYNTVESESAWIEMGDEFSGFRLSRFERAEAAIYLVKDSLEFKLPLNTAKFDGTWKAKSTEEWRTHLEKRANNGDQIIKERLEEFDVFEAEAFGFSTFVKFFHEHKPSDISDDEWKARIAKADSELRFRKDLREFAKSELLKDFPEPIN